MELNHKSLKLTAKKIETFHNLGLFSTEDVLQYYPIRYDILNVNDFSEWKIKEKVLFTGEVVSQVKTYRFGRNKVISGFDVMFNDHVIKISIFNRPWAKELTINQMITISGIYMGNHKVTAISYHTKQDSKKESIVPVYSMKAGMQQRVIRDGILKILEVALDQIEEIIPDEFIRKYRLIAKKQALINVHIPKKIEDIKQAHRTLKYEEFLRFFLSIQLLKQDNEIFVFKDPKIFNQPTLDSFIANLPFEMTADQKSSLNEILYDMRSNRIMYRLVQGDVGCGKTIVAMIALYACVLSGYQGALLAPTEILARQHAESFQKLLSDTGLRIAVLYSGMSIKEINSILEETAIGEIDILVGTHSLFQERVKFRKLGLVVADEQQRFGVAQRRSLKEKGDKVDFLLMSATPIPRTLASALYGDMEISTIETMPPGRKPVITKLIKENSFRSVLSDVQNLLRQGHQLYVICAAVEEGEFFHARNVLQVERNLTSLFSDEYRLGVLHGRMTSEEKQKIMDGFEKNEFQILISTTVVEVGVNVINATGMIVYNSERFGIAQLHQLRGRIQRGSHQGECWLLTDSQDERVIERLNVLVNSNNGFEISSEDLRLRGPGDILGTRQSGIPNLVLGNLTEDANMIQVARMDAQKMIERSQDLDYARMIKSVKQQNAETTRYRD